MNRHCKDCGYLMKCKQYPDKSWCSWLGIFRKPNAFECQDGFKNKD